MSINKCYYKPDFIRIMTSDKTISVKNLLLLFFIFLLFLSIFYKLFEWKIISGFVKEQGLTVPQELSIVETGNKQNDEITPSLLELTDPKLKPEDRLSVYDELDGKINIIIDTAKDYKEKLIKNKKSYAKYQTFSKFLIGRRGELFKDIIDNQIKYYDMEIESAQLSITSDYLGKNIFSVSKDKAIMSVYDDKASVSPKTLYSKYFSEIAPLEKYTRDSYSFPEEESIKKSYPYGYETLQNNKEYLGAYYLVIKDYVSEDYESATYKYKKLQNQNLKLNVDMDRLFNENSENSQNRTKAIMTTLLAKNDAIRKFETDKLGDYPFLKKISGWKRQLEMCQIYFIKGVLLAEVSKKPIESKNIEEYLLALSLITPNLDQLDKDFDKSIMEFTNDEKYLTIKCDDKEADRSYTYKLAK
jgi:hypothetical protein